MPVVGLLLMGLVQLFYHRTAYGKQLKAVAWNPEAAGLMGINIPRAVMASYALSALLAGVAGVLLAPLLNVSPQMGTIIGLKAFAVAIIGGLTLGARHRGGRTGLWAGGVLHRRLRLDAGARDRGLRPGDPRPRGEAVGIARREALEAGVTDRLGWASLAVAAALIPAPHLQHVLPLCRHIGGTPHHRDGRAQRARGLHRADLARSCRTLRLRRLYRRALRHPCGNGRMGRRRRRHRCHVPRRRRRGRRRAPRLRTLSGHGHHRLRPHRGGRAHRVGLGDREGPAASSTSPSPGCARHYWTVMLAAALALWLTANLRRSAWGRACLAVKSSEVAAESLGLSAYYVRIAAFTVSAAFAGAAGALFTFLNGYISPDSFTLQTSILFLLALLFGGARAHRGTRGGQRGADRSARAPHQAPRLPADSLRIAAPAVDLLAARGCGGALSKARRSKPAPLAPRLQAPRLQAPRLQAPQPGLAPEGRGRDEGELLVASEVSLSFGGVTALADVSLTVSRRRIHAVIGPNGAGKTSLLNVLSGFYAPGRRHHLPWTADRSAGVPPYAIARRGIARTFQTAQVFGGLSVRDNVAVGVAGPRLGSPSGGARGHAGQPAPRGRASSHGPARCSKPSASPRPRRRAGRLARLRTQAQARDRPRPRHRASTSHARRACRRPLPHRDRGPRRTADRASRTGAARPSSSSSITWTWSWRSLTGSPCSTTGASSPTARPRRFASHPAVIEAYLGVAT